MRARQGPGAAWVWLIFTGVVWFAAWRVVEGAERWFAWNPEAGDVVMWTLVAAAVVVLLGAGAGLGIFFLALGAQQLVVRVTLDEREPMSLLGVLLTQQIAQAQRPAILDGTARPTITRDGAIVVGSDGQCYRLVAISAPSPEAPIR